MSKEGVIVIVCSTGQAGTVVQNNNNELWILLANGDICVCQANRVRLPQSQEDLDACPLDVERIEPKITPRLDD
jgi:hypothetical protein